jgi:hypothetical protein
MVGGNSPQAIFARSEELRAIDFIINEHQT